MACGTTTAASSSASEERAAPTRSRDRCTSPAPSSVPLTSLFPCTLPRPRGGWADRRRRRLAPAVGGPFLGTWPAPPVSAPSTAGARLPPPARSHPLRARPEGASRSRGMNQSASWTASPIHARGRWPPPANSSRRGRLDESRRPRRPYTPLTARSWDGIWDSRGSGRRDSNPRHLAWEASALPTELRPHLAQPSRFGSVARLGRARLARTARERLPPTRPSPRRRGRRPGSPAGARSPRRAGAGTPCDPR